MYMKLFRDKVVFMKKKTLTYHFRRHLVSSLSLTQYLSIKFLRESWVPIVFPGRRIMFSWSRDISIHIMLKHCVARQFMRLFQNGEDYIGNVSEIFKPYKEKKRRNCATVRAEANSSVFFREKHR